MATPYLPGRTITVIAGEAIGANIRVKYNSSGNVVICGVGEAHDGITCDDVASGDEVAMMPAGFPGIQKVVMSGTGSVGGLIYGAAAGKASTTVSGLPIGQLEETAADGATCVFLPRQPSRSVTFTPTAVKTAAYTAVNGDMVLCDPSGGAFAVTLPAAVPGELPILVKNNTTSTNAITITRAGSDTIDGATTLAMTTSRQSVMLIPGVAQWHRVVSA